MRYGLVAIVLILAAATVGAQPQVYRWVDANGVVHFSDSRPDKSENVEAETIVVPDLPTRFETVRPPANRATVSDSREHAAASAESPLVMPTAAQTRECFAASPLKESGRDLYEDGGPPTPLTAEEIESLRKILNEMSGRWTGEETALFCSGNPERPEKQTSNRDIASEGQLESRDNFALHSTLSTLSTSRRERLRIALRHDQLWINNGGATLLFASDRVLSFGHRLQTGGTLSEYYWRIESDSGRSLTVEHVVYHNGALGSTSSWDLRPR